MKLNILSYNIHKGWHWGGRSFNLEGMRGALHDSGADVVFLQEVVGQNLKYAERLENWHHGPHFERLADGLWHHYSYAKNAVYDHGHHGNVILSKYPIIESGKLPISTNRFEQRGVLYSKIEIPAESSDVGRPLHVWLFCVHLNLLHSGRTQQYQMLVELVRRLTKPEETVIVAGDFNDWNQRASLALEDDLQVTEAHRGLHGRYARTFPAFLPFLCLDRIYVRQAKADACHVLSGLPWNQLSDHLPLFMQLSISC